MWRAFAIAGVTLGGLVLFPVAGVIPWAWARECGGPGALHAAGFLGPGVAAIVALDRWIWTRRLTAGLAASTVLLAIFGTWVLGLFFFATQWGC